MTDRKGIDIVFHANSSAANSNLNNISFSIGELVYISFGFPMEVWRLFPTLLVGDVLSSPGVSRPAMRSSGYRHRFHSPSSLLRYFVFSLEYYCFVLRLSILDHLCPSLLIH